MSVSCILQGQDTESIKLENGKFIQNFEDITQDVQNTVGVAKHASTHAIGGDDLLSPNDIGAVEESEVGNLYLWEKSDSEGNIEYVTDSDATAYPESGELNGYTYELKGKIGELGNSNSEEIDKVFKYRWGKRGIVEEINRGDTETVTINTGYYTINPTNPSAGLVGSSVYTALYYSDNITYNPLTDTMSLVNYEGSSSVILSTIYLNNVKGKYWSTEGTSELSQVYYTPVDADDAVSGDTSASGYPFYGYVAIDAFTVEYRNSVGEWENIWADTEDAYPHSGEVITYEDDTRTEKIEYDYEGRPYDTLIDGTCELIQWAGTGTFGAENPTVLTFRGTPRLVLIYDAALPAFHILLRPLATGRCTGTSSSVSFDFIDNAVWDENTLTWYHDESSFDSYDDTAIYQQQKANTEYYALAFYK